MYCIKCGSENLETAKFCRKCGEPFDIEQETKVAVRNDVFDKQQSSVRPVHDMRPDIVGHPQSFEADREIFCISPTLMFVKAGYVGAAVAALLLVAATAAFTSISSGWAVSIGLLLFLVPAYFHIRQKLVHYVLTESKLEIDTGFLSRTTRNVPIRRIQDVTVSATPWQRLLGFGDVVIDNASEQGGKVALKNIDSPRKYAEQLLDQMRHEGENVRK